MAAGPPSLKWKTRKLLWALPMFPKGQKHYRLGTTAAVTPHLYLWSFLPTATRFLHFFRSLFKKELKMKSSQECLFKMELPAPRHSLTLFSASFPSTTVTYDNMHAFITCPHLSIAVWGLSILFKFVFPDPRTAPGSTSKGSSEQLTTHTSSLPKAKGVTTYSAVNVWTLWNVVGFF